MRLIPDVWLEVRSPHEVVRQRGRALIKIYISYMLLCLPYVLCVLVLPSYEGRRLLFLGVILTVELLYLYNITLCRRGKLDMSIGISSFMITAGCVLNTLMVQRFTTSIWLLPGVAVLACFSTRPRQVFWPMFIVCLGLVVMWFGLTGHVPDAILHTELARGGILAIAGSAMAYLLTSAHSSMIARQRDLHQITLDAMCQEMTHRERAEHERVLAEQASDAKSRFLANMSHELRTPLNAILGYSELLHEDLQEHDEVPESLLHDATCVQGASRHLLELIQDVLNLSDIESGELKMNVMTFDLNDMCAQILGSMQLTAMSRHNTLGYTCSDEVLNVSLDPVWVRQILFNLLSNAIKFTHEGQISLDVQLDDEGALELVVSDTGVGMSEQEQERVFEEFVQANEETRREFGGTGLGLSLCYKLVQQMQGTLSLHSVLGEGTRVCCTLPQWRSA